MGGIFGSVRYFRDTIIEYLAYKTGIFLIDYYVRDLLAQQELKDSPFSVELDDAPGCRFRSEVIEELILKLRARLGNLPDELSGTEISVNWINSVIQEGFDPEPLFHLLPTLYEEERTLPVTPELIQEISQTTKLPVRIVYSFFEMMVAELDRNPWLDIHQNCRHRLWNTKIPLAELFESETLPATSPQQYLDQRLINYLARNPGSLDRIHWRNFERLIADFFQKLGYEVELGPGRNDGGIDVRIWSKQKSSIDPPLILVQCKRYGPKQEVKIEYVKALYADVDFEQARHGLIVTTSKVAPGGHKICEARGWPLTLVENDTVTEWVQSMWRHPGEYR